MTNFQESIVALTAIRNSIERALLCLYSADGTHLVARTERIKDSVLIFTLQNYIQILLCSFLDEWQAFSSFAKNDDSVKKTARILAPAIDQFKKWPGLHKVRSNMLAHSPRDRGKKIFFPWVAFKNLRCPTTPEEIILLALCALRSVDYVKEQYKTEQIEAEKEILKADRSIAVQGIANIKELERTFSEIQKQIEQNKLKLG